MAHYRTEIPDKINELLISAAKRDKRSKEKFIHSLLEKAANKEKKKQKEDEQ